MKVPQWAYEELRRSYRPDQMYWVEDVAEHETEMLKDLTEERKRLLAEAPGGPQEVS